VAFFPDADGLTKEVWRVKRLLNEASSVRQLISRWPPFARHHYDLDGSPAISHRCGKLEVSRRDLWLRQLMASDRERRNRRRGTKPTDPVLTAALMRYELRGRPPPRRAPPPTAS
jgi:hypothetical protein